MVNTFPEMHVSALPELTTKRSSMTLYARAIILALFSYEAATERLP